MNVTPELIRVRNWYLAQIGAIKQTGDWADYSRQCRVVFQTALSKARAVSSESDKDLTDFLQRG